MRRRLALATIWLGAACGRLGFDSLAPPGDATGIPDDTGVTATACPTMPVTGGMMVSTTAQLKAALTSVSPGTTLLLADGTYDLPSQVAINKPGITIRSASNRADAVIIDGNGTANPIFNVSVANVSFISVTLRNTAQDAIFIEPGSATGDATGAVIYDVTFTDVRGPAVRAKSYMALATSPFADNGTFACSRVGHTATADCGSDGAFGVRLAGVRNWVVRDNYFAGQCGATRSRAIAASSGARDIQIISNVFAGNGNNILAGDVMLRTYPDALPAGCSGTPMFWGGVICNNRITALTVPPRSGNDFEEGIALWGACDTWVLHNTVVSPAGTETLENIEYRFPEAYVHLINNVIEAAPLARDSGTIDPLSTSVVYASTAEFVNASAGDVRLATTSTISPGAPITKCLTDAAGVARNAGGPTPGAYER